MDLKRQSLYNNIIFSRYRDQNKGKLTKAAIFKESIKTVSKEYCEESSICGLKHLVSDKTPHVERIIWIVVLIGAIFCSISLVWMMFIGYYRAPLVTTQLPEGISVSKIIFPAVGICPNNRISKRAVTELARRLLKESRNAEYDEVTMLEMLYGLRQLYMMQPMDERIISPIKLHKILGEYEVDELIKSLTPKCEDILIMCAWNEVPKKCMELFDFRLTQTGYCCTFNYLRQSDTFEDRNSSLRNVDQYQYGNKSTFDYDQGLKVLLRLNDSDDFFYAMPIEGFQLQFSDAYDFPDAPSGSFSVQIISPDVQMTVSVTASFTEASRDIQHVPVKIRGCLFYDESPYLPFYTSSDCYLKCRMLFLLEKCNCTPFNMPRMSNARTCDLRDVFCLRLYYSQSISVRPLDINPIPRELELEMVGGGISCPMCYPTCSKTVYSYDFYNVDIYPDQLNAVHDEDRIDWLQGVNFTGTSIVHVKYAREVADCYGQNVIMKWFDLISNIGSTCGFVTGLSFVSVLEFIYFFSVKLVREIRTRHQQQIHAVHPVGEPTPAHHDSIHVSRYRPIYWNELTGSTRVTHSTGFE